MTSRERFSRAMRFQNVDRLPVVHMGFWDDTLRRWEKEGMADLKLELEGFDGPMQNCWLYGQYQEPIPAFDEKVLREDENSRDLQNRKGQIERCFKSQTSMPAFLEFPVKNRRDWDEYRKRFDPDSAGRYPDEWERLVAERKGKAADEVRGVAVWGFYGFPREMCGTEALSYLFYDEPSLVEEMNEYWLYFTMKRLERGLCEMDFDYALIWEDNCYNHGMLHSPEIFRKYMAPHYCRLIKFFHKHGIELISVDSDGNVNELIPLLLDVGVTGIHPFEVASGMDVVTIGREYPLLQIWGGLDKRVLAFGKKEIDEELERVIPVMKRRGGYAAGLDHGVPSNVPLENFRYFKKKLLEISKL